MRRIGRFAPYLVVACAYASSACTSSVETGPLESSEVGFEDLALSATVVSNGVAARVDARVTSRRLGRPVNLEEGDALFVEDGATRLALAPIEGGGVLVFPSTAQRLDVLLVRGDSENRIPLTLPSPFVLTAPAKASRTEGFTVTFEADQLLPTKFLVGTAGSGKFARTAAKGIGELTVNGADIVGKTPFTVEVRALREADGGAQVRTVEVEIVP